MEEEVINKTALLRWTSGMLHQNCYTFEKLKDGSVLVQLFGRLFPSVVNLKTTKWVRAPMTTDEVLLNFSVVELAVEQLGLPKRTLDIRGIRATDFTPCFNLLVMLHLLHHLTQSPHYRAAIAHPLPDYLMHFFEDKETLSGIITKVCISESSDEGLPDIGSFVEVVNMQSTNHMNLNGIRGCVVEKEFHRVSVAFPEPFGKHWVQAGNLKLIKPPGSAPPEGSSVVATNMNNELDGQIGVVTGKYDAADGLRVIVEFPDPHGPMLILAGNLELVNETAAIAIKTKSQSPRRADIDDNVASESDFSNMTPSEELVRLRLENQSLRRILKTQKCEFDAFREASREMVREMDAALELEISSSRYKRDCDARIGEGYKLEAEEKCHKQFLDFVRRHSKDEEHPLVGALEASNRSLQFLADFQSERAAQTVRLVDELLAHSRMLLQVCNYCLGSLK